MATLQDLGLVTAYGYAKAGGFSGSEADFQNYMGNLPAYASSASDSATAAAASANAAAGIVTQVGTIYDNTVEVYNNTVTEAAAAVDAQNRAEQFASGAATSMAQAASQAAASTASALAAGTSESNALDSATASARSATNAATQAAAAQAAAEGIGAIADAASASAQTANRNAILARSWAEGGTGTRTGENSNNAKYWCEQAQAIVGIDVFTGATASTNGAQGIVPAPTAGQQNNALFGDGTWRHMYLTFVGTTAEWTAEEHKEIFSLVVLTDN